VSRRLRPTALAIDLLYYINAGTFILTKMFQDLNIDFEMLDASEKYFVSTYLNDTIFLNCTPVKSELFTRGNTKTI